MIELANTTVADITRSVHTNLLALLASLFIAE